MQLRFVYVPFKNAFPAKKKRKNKISQKVLQMYFLKYSLCTFSFHQVIREMLHEILLIVEDLVPEHFSFFYFELLTVIYSGNRRKKCVTLLTSIKKCSKY